MRVINVISNWSLIGCSVYSTSLYFFKFFIFLKGILRLKENKRLIQDKREKNPDPTLIRNEKKIYSYFR